MTAAEALRIGTKQGDILYIPDVDYWKCVRNREYPGDVFDAVREYQATNWRDDSPILPGFTVLRYRVRPLSTMPVPADPWLQLPEGL